MKRKGKATNAQGYLVCGHERGPDDPTEYDLALKAFGASSPDLANWVRRNYRSLYVPEDVLAAMGLEERQFN